MCRCIETVAKSGCIDSGGSPGFYVSVAASQDAPASNVRICPQRAQEPSAHNTPSLPPPPGVRVANSSSANQNGIKHATGYLPRGRDDQITGGDIASVVVVGNTDACVGAVIGRCVQMEMRTLVLLLAPRMVGNGSAVGVLGGGKLGSRGSNGERGVGWLKAEGKNRENGDDVQAFKERARHCRQALKEGSTWQREQIEIGRLADAAWLWRFLLKFNNNNDNTVIIIINHAGGGVAAVGALLAIFRPQPHQ
ncbi:hypothetical protein AC579_9729 [Pseudocercospora musae]|uniref:Uncharacterized protein n=1 Tax=Pseudocercospora musae TaxID=113226 RepID=A0A139HZE1_9PEZI|nr:hypothetical protein AC579_9729 [Pseudocercospora musae]